MLPFVGGRVVAVPEWFGKAIRNQPRSVRGNNVNPRFGLLIQNGGFSFGFAAKTLENPAHAIVIFHHLNLTEIN